MRGFLVRLSRQLRVPPPLRGRKHLTRRADEAIRNLAQGMRICNGRRPLTKAIPMRSPQIPTEAKDHERRQIGANNGPRLSIDPGPALDYTAINGPLTFRREAIVERALELFCEAIRSQGGSEHRQLAITNMLHRARANPAISHRGYRVLEEIASRCRWEYRYHAEPMEAVAFYTGQKSGSNMGRILAELRDADVLTTIAVPRKAGGRPMTFCTVVCTPEDSERSKLGSSEGSSQRSLQQCRASQALAPPRLAP